MLILSLIPGGGGGALHWKVQMKQKVDKRRRESIVFSSVSGCTSPAAASSAVKQSVTQRYTNSQRRRIRHSRRRGFVPTLSQPNNKLGEGHDPITETEAAPLPSSPPGEEIPIVLRLRKKRKKKRKEDGRKE